VMALRPGVLCRPTAVAARTTWPSGCADSRRSLCVVVSARSGSTVAALAGKLGGNASRRAAGRQQPAVLLRLFATESGADHEQTKKEKARLEEDERTAAILKRKLARDVETARNLVRHLSTPCSAT
jgi:transposase-like protein